MVSPVGAAGLSMVDGHREGRNMWMPDEPGIESAAWAGSLFQCWFLNPERSSLANSSLQWRTMQGWCHIKPATWLPKHPEKKTRRTRVPLCLIEKAFSIKHTGQCNGDYGWGTGPQPTSQPVEAHHRASGPSERLCLKKTKLLSPKEEWQPSLSSGLRVHVCVHARMCAHMWEKVRKHIHFCCFITII